MKNLEIAKIFYEMAEILEMQEVEWKPQAYRKAALNIETLSEDIEALYKKGGIKALMEIPGVGEGIAKKIVQYLDKGVIEEYENLKKSLPSGLMELMSIQGLGPKKVWKLYKELGIGSLKKLEEAAKQGKIRNLEGFGEKSEEDILLGLELFKKGQERTILGRVLPIAREIADELKKLKEVEKVDVAGSLRRRKETIGDIDILVVSKTPKKVMDFFVSMNSVSSVLAKGETKSSVVLKQGLNCDLRVLEEKSYGAALMYFTGSKEHNISLRQLAIKKGYKLSEYGLFDKRGKFICGRTEKEVYEKLGLPYIEPEMREDNGEIEAAQKKALPKLIQYNSIKGDLHVHTNWSDGSYSTEEMIKAAINLGYEYVAITDHSKSEHVANGLDEKRLKKHIEEIEKLQKKYSKIKILKGSEVDILANGNLDYPDDVLKKLDIVVASIHSRFKSDKEEMTKRILKALENPHVTILAHPTGRLINQRNPYDADMEKIFQKAKDNGVFLEINAFPSRLDLRDSHIKSAIEIGAKLVIDTDSHATDQLKFMELGIAQARRGWAEARDVANTLPAEKFLKAVEK